MNRTSSYDALFARDWQWLLEQFRQGTQLEYAPREVSPGKGNPRRVEYMDEEVIRLRETTARGLPGMCPMTQLRDDFWKLCQDPEVENKPLSLLRQQHGIKNFVEFKRHMFEEFRQFARGLPDLPSALVSTETAGGHDGAIDQVTSLPGLHLGIIPPDSHAVSGGEAPQNKARSQGTTNAAPPKRSATEASPRPVSTLPPFQGAQEYLERLRALAGLPERNVEDAVKDLLLYLGHERGRILFQIGRIDVAVQDHTGRTAMVIEVKRSLGSASQRDDALRKGFDYASRTGARYVVVTDADRFEIYDRLRGLDHASMLCAQFQFTAFRESDAAALDLLRPQTSARGEGVRSCNTS